MGERHPGGRTCQLVLPLAVLFTLWSIVRHPRQVRDMWHQT